MASVSAVIISYDEPREQTRAAVESLLAQTRPPVEIIVFNNGAAGRLRDALAGYPASVRGIECRENLGFIALNEAAEQACGDYLLCINPDARARRECLERLTATAEADASIAIVGAQILLEDGATRNAGANPLHPTGISPSGGFGEQREGGPPRDVMVVSGACFLARRSAFLELGGLARDLFLYYDDVNLCWRARLAGLRVVYCPRAIVTHGYEFSARGGKWFLLERNRLYTLLSHYEARTLALLAPLLLATEAGVLAVAARGGWLTDKLSAYAALWRMRRRLMGQRRRVQAARRRSDAELLGLFDDRLDSALMPKAATTIANCFAVPYMALVRRLLASPPRQGAPEAKGRSR